MLSLALAVVVSGVSGGLLSETPVVSRGVRLIETPLAFTGATALAATPWDRMSLQELHLAREEELSNRRGVGGAVVLLSLGVVAFIATYVVVALAAVWNIGVIPALAILIAGTVAGVVLVAVGVGLLIGTIVRNAKVSKHVRAIDARIEQLQRPQQYPPQPVGPPQPLTPPPPPPVQGFAPLEPSFQLASF